MQKSIPDHSPLLAPNVVCSGCGETIPPEVVKSGRGVVEVLRYKHVNKEKGCSYYCESNTYLTAEMRPMRADGSDVKL